MTLYKILSLCGIPSLIGAIFVSAVNYVKLKNSSYKLIKDGVIAILHNKIYTLGKQYIAQEHISVEALDDFVTFIQGISCTGREWNRNRDSRKSNGITNKVERSLK